MTVVTDTDTSLTDKFHLLYYMPRKRTQGISKMRFPFSATNKVFNLFSCKWSRSRRLQKPLRYRNSSNLVYIVGSSINRDVAPFLLLITIIYLSDQRNIIITRLVNKLNTNISLFLSNFATRNMISRRKELNNYNCVKFTHLIILLTKIIY